MSRIGFVLASSVLIASAAIGACSHLADDCENTSTCPPEGGSSSAGSATGGKDGTSGSNSTAGATNPGGAGSSAGGSQGGNAAAAGEAGLGGGGGSALLPCDGACAAPKPVCDEPSDTCVECLTAGDCTAASGKPQCDTAAKACVECLASSECANAAAAKCEGGACVKCTSNDDCAHVAGKTVCDAGAGECVQCTGKDYASCGLDMGTPLVCDTKARSCTTKKMGSSGLCQTCVSDAQCSAGKLCVEEKYGNQAQSVGFFCFYRQGDTANGAPADCFADGAPYAKALLNQTTIDGASGDICGLQLSTCVARNQFRSKDCATANSADDSKCGFAPGKDSKCDQVGASANFRCTMTCGSDEDCPSSFTCNTAANPAVCSLQ